MVRIWVDGCFDTMHFGHANALRQARLMGHHLVVGVHSDKEILLNKGPTVMNEKERYAAVRYCKYADEVVEDAPYLTMLEYLDKYNCDFCVHGDDITTLADGSDCYAIVKAANRYKECKRTVGVSTTDLIKRMLKRRDEPNGHSPIIVPKDAELELFSNNSSPSGKVAVICGTWDMFHIGHMEFLKNYEDYYVIVKVIKDEDVYAEFGSYPVMTVYERALGVLACRFVDQVVLGNDYKGQVDLEVSETLELRKQTEDIIKRILNDHERYEARNKKKDKQ